MSTEVEKIKALLSGVVDPELMVNVVDLGLIYDLRIDASTHKIDIDLTLTSQGCPMGDLIIEDIEQTVSANYPDFKVAVNLVWEPEWTYENLTEKGREALEGN